MVSATINAVLKVVPKCPMIFLVLPVPRTRYTQNATKSMGQKLLAFLSELIARDYISSANSGCSSLNDKRVGSPSIIYLEQTLKGTRTYHRPDVKRKPRTVKEMTANTIDAFADHIYPDGPQARRKAVPTTARRISVRNSKTIELAQTVPDHGSRNASATSDNCSFLSTATNVANGDVKECAYDHSEAMLRTAHFNLVGSLPTLAAL